MAGMPEVTGNDLPLQKRQMEVYQTLKEIESFTHDQPAKTKLECLQEIRALVQKELNKFELHKALLHQIETLP